MKKIIILFLLSIVIIDLTAQSIKPITDPHIRSQQDRMVFQKWGEWLPKKKFFLGVQTNVHHTMTWGWMAPSQNKKYMQGSDIRPLGPTGEQTQRTTSLMTMKLESDRIKTFSDTIGATAISELYNYTGGAISEVDPLWNLYYKKMLANVRVYKLSNFTNKLNSKQRTYMTENGIIKWFDDEMLRLNERLGGAFAVSMDRGSRILNYHRILLEYEKVMNEWNNQRVWSETLLTIKEQNNKVQNIQNLNFSTWKNNDVKIMRQVIQDAKKIY